ncbi:ATP-binding protein, partial [Streptomyces sp. NPDC005899]|uniref:ATP-binding protein n=1 Tax=Streptomyces sp. NPDC005899 TaxID=3155716 RepID=UPI0033FBA594
MGDQNAPGPSPRRFPPRPESVASARHFVRTALGDTAPDVVHTAELLAGELVTNAVLHARTQVQVSVRHAGGRIHVRVTDERPGRSPVPREDPSHSWTGWGLVLVERLARRYGVDAGPSHKTVWFDLRTGGGPPPPPSGWGTPACSGVTVTLIDFPAALYAACRRRRHALLRELVLAGPAAGLLGVRPGDLVTAHDTSNLISACVAAATGRQPSAADARSLPPSLSLSVPADAAPAVLTLRHVLDLAEEAAREEHLLGRPTLPQARAFRAWLFDQIAGQLAGAHPTAWTVVPRDPSVNVSGLVPWEPAHIQAGRTPAVAADEENRIIAVNDPAAAMLGWEVDDLLGRRLTTLVPEHLRQRNRAAFSSLLLTGRPRILGRSVPLPALHRDGRLVPVRLVIQTQETADGRTVFVAQLTPRTVEPAPSTPSPGTARPAPPREPDGPEPADGPRGTGTGVGGPAALSALERLALLADTGTALSGAVDLSEGLRRVCRILTRRLAHWCVVDLLDEHGHVQRVCLSHRRAGELAPEAYGGTVPPASDTARGPLARVLRGAGPL